MSGCTKQGKVFSPDHETSFTASMGANQFLAHSFSRYKDQEYQTEIKQQPAICLFELTMIISHNDNGV